MKHYFLMAFITLMSFSTTINAQEVKKREDSKVFLRLDARLDGQLTTYGKDDITGLRPENEGGFVGRYFKILLDGSLSDKFTYSFRHRLYVNPANPKDFFSATDWLNVTYKPNSKFSLTAGKQMVLIGTMEYDYAPVDVYYASDFWNHVNPFQIGVNVGFSPSKKHTIYAQFVNSPFSSKAFENIYAYNLMWYGTITKWFKTIYSVNMVEYEKSNFINYIALGNRFTFDRTEIDLDYMNRYAGKGTAFFEDFTIGGKVAYQVSNSFKIFTKGGYDQNKAQVKGTEFAYDRYVLPGVQKGFYGAGVEYFPLTTANTNLRFHAFWYSTSENPIPQTFNIGLRWQMRVLER